MRTASCLVLFCLVVLVGCATGPALDAPGVMLYAIDPVDIDGSAAAGDDPAKGTFHRYRVLGRVDLTETERGAELLAYLEEEADMLQGPIAGCFEPRHALRVERAGVATDYVLCFACQQFDWYEPGQDVRSGKQTLDPAWRDRFTDPLTEAGIELAD